MRPGPISQRPPEAVAAALATDHRSVHPSEITPSIILRVDPDEVLTPDILVNARETRDRRIIEAYMSHDSAQCSPRLLMGCDAWDITIDPPPTMTWSSYDQQDCFRAWSAVRHPHDARRWIAANLEPSGSRMAYSHDASGCVDAMLAVRAIVTLGACHDRDDLRLMDKALDALHEAHAYPQTKDIFRALRLAVRYRRDLTDHARTSILAHHLIEQASPIHVQTVTDPRERQAVCDPILPRGKAYDQIPNDVLPSGVTGHVFWNAVICAHDRCRSQRIPIRRSMASWVTMARARSPGHDARHREPGDTVPAIGISKQVAYLTGMIAGDPDAWYDTARTTPEAILPALEPYHDTVMGKALADRLLHYGDHESDAWHEALRSGITASMTAWTCAASTMARSRHRDTWDRIMRPDWTAHVGSVRPLDAHDTSHGPYAHGSWMSQGHAYARLHAAIMAHDPLAMWGCLARMIPCRDRTSSMDMPLFTAGDHQWNRCAIVHDIVSGSPTMRFSRILDKVLTDPRIWSETSWLQATMDACDHRPGHHEEHRDGIAAVIIIASQACSPPVDHDRFIDRILRMHEDHGYAFSYGSDMTNRLLTSSWMTRPWRRAILDVQMRDITRNDRIDQPMPPLLRLPDHHDDTWRHLVSQPYALRQAVHMGVRPSHLLTIAAIVSPDAMVTVADVLQSMPAYPGDDEQPLTTA